MVLIVWKIYIYSNGNTVCYVKYFLFFRELKLKRSRFYSHRKVTTQCGKYLPILQIQSIFYYDTKENDLSCVILLKTLFLCTYKVY